VARNISNVTDLQYGNTYSMLR